MKIIGVLAVVQSGAGILRALQWFDIGSDLMGQGVMLLPLAGMLVYGRGVIVVLLALAFLVFAVGVFLQRTWARSLGIGVAVVNLLLLLLVLVQGESLGRVISAAVIPGIIVWYLFAPAGREALPSKSET